MRVFCDANVLFSAALGGPAFDLLVELVDAGRVELVTSRYCLVEAEVNLRAKRPEAMDRYTGLLGRVRRVPERDELPEPLADLVPEKDVPVLAAAVSAEADVLLTGDVTHFGSLMQRDDLPLRVRTPRAFLLEGPD